MKNISSIILFLFICGCLQAKVVISQIMYDTPLNEQTNRPPYCNGEFVEIYNAGAEDISLTNWKLQGVFGDSFIFPANTSLSAGTSLIIAFKHPRSRSFNLNTLLPDNQLGIPCEIIYQSNIMLGNLGEALKLITSNNTVEDSIFYMNIANNQDNLTYSLCLSLHRTRISLNMDGSIKADMNDWTADYVCRGCDTPIEEFYYNASSPLYDTLPSKYNYRLVATPLDSTRVLTLDNGHVEPSSKSRIRLSCDIFDGLGRRQQTVARRQSTDLLNMSTLTEYDARNNDIREWLPVYSKRDTILSTNALITNSRTIYNDNSPYFETSYEDSPLNKQIASTKEGSLYKSHPALIEYATNAINEVVRWQASPNGLLRSGYYLPGSLHKTTVTNEDGKEFIEYRDYQNKLLLQKQGKENLFASTYYVYDNFSRLTYVLPPNSLTFLHRDSLYGENDSAIMRFAYIYHYNSRDLLVSKKLPGCEEIRMIYDKSNKLILSQDGNQRARGCWTYNAYDNTRRLMYQAEVKINNSDYAQLTMIYKDQSCTESVTDNTDNYNIGYTTEAITYDAFKPLLAYYYDDYSFMNNLSQANHDSLDYRNNNVSDERYMNTNRMLTGMRVYNLSDNQATIYSYYYNIAGNTVQQHSIDALNNHYSLFAKYNHDGSIASSKIINNNHIEYSTYIYDHVGRLRKHLYQIDDNPRITLSHNFYDKLGHLAQTLLHNGQMKNRYTYDIRNNLSALESEPYTEYIYRAENLPSSTVALYDGSISAATKIYPNTEGTYRFNYDALSRLTQSSLEMEGESTTSEQLTYDLQGNILTLQRYNNDALIDNLTYSYNGNQVYSIEESANTIADMTKYGYIDRSHLDTTIRYDANGNMTMDLDRNITAIKYNLLNLPDTIVFSTGGDSIINEYNALGEKLKTAFYANNNYKSIVRYNRNIETYSFKYPNSVEYTTEKELVYNDEGYCQFGFGGSISQFSQYYYCRDYLGNIVAVWNADTKQIEQQTLYYASGLPMNNSTGDNLQAYKYNNKELIAQFGLNEYDSEARYYYPAIGRTTTMDPLAEDYYHISPYAWCGNNWVNVIDLSGEAPVTQAPKEIMGGPYYYYYRNKDYASRHQGFDNDYYKNYGEKYNAKFKFQTKPKLSPLGQKWVDEVALNLQIALENRLTQDDGMEFEASTDFNSYAYTTHVEAYKNEDKEGETTPLCVLPLKDVWLIARTPELQDSFGSIQGLKQILQIGAFLVISYSQQAIDEIQDLYEDIKKQMKDYIDTVFKTKPL